MEREKAAERDGVLSPVPCVKEQGGLSSRLSARLGASISNGRWYLETQAMGWRVTAGVVIPSVPASPCLTNFKGPHPIPAQQAGLDR
jgi:hypothetical protein